MDKMMKEKRLKVSLRDWRPSYVADGRRQLQLSERLMTDNELDWWREVVESRELVQFIIEKPPTYKPLRKQGYVLAVPATYRKNKGPFVELTISLIETNK